MLTIVAAAMLAAALPAAAHDLVITNGLIVDGTGAAPFPGWVAVDGDRIASWQRKNKAAVIPMRAPSRPGACARWRRPG